MDAFPAFRRRDVNTRRRYTLLDNESDTTSNHSISSRSSQSRGNHGNNFTLCDRCWLKHERQQASKRCLECRQNMCLICARQDMVKRPWWLPAVLVQCWRFFFSKSFIPHSFVELSNSELASDRRSWVHTQEASHIQPIPRVTRDSLRSNRSNSKANGSRYAYDNHSFVTRQTEQSPLVHKKQLHTENLPRSRSFEGFKAQRRMRQRRSRSVELISGTPWVKDRPSDDRYEKNWDDNDILSFKTDPSKRRIVKGKDIDIELNSEDIRLTVNEDSNPEGEDSVDRKLKKSKCAIKKTKHKKSKQLANPEPYTEQIFSDHPIWFKRESSLPKKDGKMNNMGSKTRTDEQNEQLRQHMRRNNQSDRNRHLREKLNTQIFESPININRNNDRLEKTQQRTDEPISKNMASNSFATPRQNKNGLPRPGNTRPIFNNPETTMAYIVEEPPDPCPICLEDLPKYESRVLHCSHKIHTRCLREMLNSTDIDFGIRCPVCNQMTQVKNYYAPPKLWYRELPVSTSI